MAAPASVRDVIGRRGATMLEVLDGGGLLLVRDSAEAEGRSVLRALVTEAVAREQPVLVVLLEVPRERFLQGLSPEVAQRLHFRDLFGDPLGWLSRERPSPTPSPTSCPSPTPSPTSCPSPTCCPSPTSTSCPAPLLEGLLRGAGPLSPPLPHPGPSPTCSPSCPSPSPSPSPLLGGAGPLPPPLPHPPQPGPSPTRCPSCPSPTSCPSPFLEGLLGGAGPLWPPLPHPHPQPGPSPTLVLDSLSWALLRLPLPHLCRGGLLGGGRGPNNEPPCRVVALLHQELHPPALLGALSGLARAQLILNRNRNRNRDRNRDRDPPRVTVLREPRGGGGARQETLTLLPDGSLGPLPQPDPSPNFGDGEEPPKTPNFPKNPQNPGLPPLTFRLGLSGRERGARAALRPPYLPRGPPEPPPEDPEDPDDDLDL